MFPLCCLTQGQTVVEVMKIMANSFKRSHAPTAALSAPKPAAGHCRLMPLPETPGHSWTSLGQSLVGSLLLSPGSWCAQGSVCALQGSVSQFCVSSGCSLVGLMVTSSKEGLCHTKVCCTQSPCPGGRPLLTHTSTGDTQLRFVCLCRVSGSWCTQSLFEPSGRLWWIRGLILNVISPHVSLSECREMVMGREAWYAAIHGVTKGQTRLSD